MHTCYYCKQSEEEMRPYGPEGAMICFECATETPEREAETKANFGAQLDAAGPPSVTPSISCDVPRCGYHSSPLITEPPDGWKTNVVLPI